MAHLIQVKPMSAAGIRATHHDILVYRDDDDSIRLVLINEALFADSQTAALAHVMPEIEVRILLSRKALSEFFPDDDAKFYLLFVAEPSGKIASAYNGRTLVELRWASMDLNWPSVVTVTTYKNKLLAVDDLPDFGMQPVVVVRRGDAEHDNADSIDYLERQLSAPAHPRQVFILVEYRRDDYYVRDVLMPRYDAQLPAGGATRTAVRHQSVPFMHIAPTRPHSSADTLLVLETKFHPLFQYALDKLYELDGAVLSWQQFGARTRRRHNPPLGWHLMLTEGSGDLSVGSEHAVREYPLFRSDTAPFAWVWTDVSQFGEDKVDTDTVKAATLVPHGALSAVVLAANAGLDPRVQKLAKWIVCRP